MNKLTRLIPLLILLAGCGTPQNWQSGIPNYAIVQPGIYRGGQPNADGWKYLQALGVTTVLKLNSEEPTDPIALSMGMNVVSFPITIWQQIGWEPISREAMDEAVRIIGKNTYVHCLHGQDRTGLAVALFRLQQGWTRADAEREMLAHGFHTGLTGLWDYWKTP